MFAKQLPSIALLATLASPAIGVQYSQFLNTTQQLSSGDILLSENNLHVLSTIGTPGTVYSAAYNSIAGANNSSQFDDFFTGCINIRLNTVGQVLGLCGNVTRTWGNASSTTSTRWKLKLSNTGVISTMIQATSTTPQIIGNVQNRTVTQWAFEAITGQSPANFCNVTRGSGVNVYLIDSGLTPNRDWSRAMSTDSGVGYWDNSVNIAADPGYGYNDYMHHGTNMANIIKSKYSGIAPGVNLFNVKVTRGNTTKFEETDILAAIRKVVFHNTTKPKIINLSIAYNGTSLAMKCAFQKAYEAGVALVIPAGNDNIKVSEHYGYALRVGALLATGLPADYSNYGNALDLWAPGQHVNNVKGTSVAAAYTTGVLAAAIEKFPTQLKNNPGRAFLYLRVVAQYQAINNSTGINVLDDPKVASSSYAGKRFLKLKFDNLTPAPGSLFNNTAKADYCQQLTTTYKLTSPATWDDLGKYLSPTADPYFVNWIWDCPRC